MSAQPTVQDRPDADAISFHVRNARLIAAFFLDFLASDPESFYPHKVRLCRYDMNRCQWRPVDVDNDTVIADFIEWCQEE